MKKIRPALFVTVLIASVFSMTVKAQTALNDAKLKLFIIGNSFSKNATHYLNQIAKEGGYEIVIGRAEIGGGSLQQHWNAVEVFERDSLSPAGRPYNGKSLKMLLKENGWEIITMQQFSFLSSDSASYEPFLTKLCAYVRGLQPDARIVLHQTWAYRNDSPGFSIINGGAKAKGQQEMWARSRNVYHHYAKALSMKIIPTGDAFWAVDSDPKLGYKKDLKYDFSKPVYPQLPDQKNSLHVGYYWDENKKLSFDWVHASTAGCYLGSLVWYGTLFNRQPKTVGFVPDGLPAPFAKTLRDVATKVVKSNKR